MYLFEQIITSLIIVCYILSTNVYKFNSSVVPKKKKVKSEGLDCTQFLFFLDKHNGA